MKPHILLLFTLLGLVGCGSQEEPPPKPVVEVKIAKAELAEVRITVRAPAYVFAREQANINARITTPIHKLLVRKGDNVAAGQVLAQLDNRDLLAQRDEAMAAVTDAEANLQRVTSGTLPADIERARGQAASAEAALNQAQKFYEWRRQLFEQGAIPQRDLLLSETEFAQAKANHEVATRALDLLQNQSRDKDILMAKSKVELKFFNTSFNLMTLGGLAACIGVVIDDAIVMVENIIVHLSSGQSPMDVAKSAITELAPALTGSTLTPIMVFPPLVLLGGVTGVFFRALAMTMVTALFASLFLAIFFTPALAALFFRRPAGAGAADIEQAQQAGEGRILRWLTTQYESALHWLLYHPRLVLLKESRRASPTPSSSSSTRSAR